MSLIRKHVAVLQAWACLALVSVVFARWQHYIRRRFALCSNGKESFSPTLDPDADPDHHQDLITSKCKPSVIIPENFSQIFLCNHANSTDK